MIIRYVNNTDHVHGKYFHVFLIQLLTCYKINELFETLQMLRVTAGDETYAGCSKNIWILGNRANSENMLKLCCITYTNQVS